LIQQDALGRFDIYGSNKYTTPGTFAISALLVNTAGQSATASSTAIVAQRMLSPVPLTVNFTVGVQPSSPVTIGSFFDSNTSAVASDFIASINWGQGQQTSPGTVTASSTTPGLFLVSGTYLYPVANTYSVCIQVQDGSGNSTTIYSTAVVVTNVVTTPANFGFWGGLALNTDNGPYASIGYTNTNRPTFSGTAVPFSTVQLNGTFWGVDAVQPLGEAVTNASGQWTLPVGPLAAGTYTITATITPPGSYPIAVNLANDGLVIIDMAPKKVIAPKHKAAKSAAARRVALRHEALNEHKPASSRRARHNN